MKTLTFLIVAAFATLAVAMDLRLTDGGTLSDIRLHSKTDRGITVAHSGGITFVDYRTMQAADARTFGFDEAKYRLAGSPATKPANAAATVRPTRPQRLYTAQPEPTPPPPVRLEPPSGSSPAGTSPGLNVTSGLQSSARSQCAATTKKGYRCSRMAQAGGSYCWQHP